jgi:uncharacterized protein YjcR
VVKSLPKAKNAKADVAFKLYKQGLKLVDIAKQLDLPAGTVRWWKSSYKWDSAQLDKNSENSQLKKCSQLENQNSLDQVSSVLDQNKCAEKHGLFTKYLPKETLDIVHNMSLNPLDILWDNIQIAYAAIVRSQQIMYVKDKDDNTILRKEDKGDNYAEKCEVQEAWDKQANFLKAQARAQTELRGLIKQYDKILHNNWELATEEQKARIALLKTKAQTDNEIEVADDGFLAALNISAREDWSNEEN